MSAAEVIELTKKLPLLERLEVAAFVNSGAAPRAEFERAAKRALVDNYDLLRQLAR